MKRLAVILPYNEQHMENFTEHFRVMVPESEDLYYKLIFVATVFDLVFILSIPSLFSVILFFSLKIPFSLS